jgi:glycosyltransferase involved in cell wall biosynthesis
MLVRDGELRGRLGAAGRERARERFSWPEATRSTVAAYRAALSR